MKKISILAITFILVALTLCACGRRRNNATDPTMMPTQQTTTTRATQPSTTATQPSTVMTRPTDGGSIPGDADSTSGTGVLDPTSENNASIPDPSGRSRGIS